MNKQELILALAKVPDNAPLSMRIGAESRVSTPLVRVEAVVSAEPFVLEPKNDQSLGALLTARVNIVLIGE